MRRRADDVERRKAASDREHFGWWQWLASLAWPAPAAPAAPADRARGKRAG